MPKPNSAPRSRRRTGVALAATAGLFAGVTLSPTLPALANGGMPAGEWGTCANLASQYCIERATLTPLGLRPLSAVKLGLEPSVTTSDSDSIAWSVDGWSALEDDLLGSYLTLSIRTGQYVPRFTVATAKDMRVTRRKDLAGNYTVTITGKPAEVAWTTGELAGDCAAAVNCGDDDQLADEEGTGWRFAGETQDLADLGEGVISSLDGGYLATDAQAHNRMVTSSEDAEPYLDLGVLGNPHLDADGVPVRGAFNAWVPGTYFTALGGSAQEAVDGGLDVVADDQVSLAAKVKVRDGGVAVQVDDIGYGMSDVRIYQRPSGADDEAGAPGAPQDVDVSSEADTVDVNWNEPESDGGSPITGYTVRAFTEPTGGTVAGRCTAEATDPNESDDPNDYPSFGSRRHDPSDDDNSDDSDDPSDDNSDDSDDPSDDNGDDSDDAGALSCSISGLTEGETYYVATSASNAYGEGLSDDRIGITAGGSQITPPSAPLAVKIRAGVNRLGVNWAEPESDGGSAITGYTVRAYAGSSQTPVAECEASALLHVCVLLKLGKGGPLVNGATYRVTVAATNEAGTGDESEPVKGTPRTTPGGPRDIAATAANGRLKVTWTAPKSTGGAALTGYRVQVYASRKGGAAIAGCFAGPRKLACTTPSLRLNRDVYVTVQALNAAGMSVEPTRIKISRQR